MCYWEGRYYIVTTLKHVPRAGTRGKRNILVGLGIKREGGGVGVGVGVGVSGRWGYDTNRPHFTYGAGVTKTGEYLYPTECRELHR